MLSIMTRTDLVYNIVEGVLSGAIDGTSICAQAGAGGRAGTKTKGAVNMFLANNPYATHVKKKAGGVGGPLPMARYHLRTHESKKDQIRLVPFPEDAEALGDRDGFLIHGRGPRGSDGCIVPTDFNVVQLIHKLVKARESAKKPAPTLAVVAVGDFERFERLNRIV